MDGLDMCRGSAAAAADHSGACLPESQCILSEIFGSSGINNIRNTVPASLHWVLPRTIHPTLLFSSF